MSKVFVILIAFVLFILPVNGQTGTVKDSLLGILKTAKADTNKVNLLLRIADEYETNEPGKAILYIGQATELSRQLSFHTGLMRGYRHFAYIYSFQSKFDSVIYYNKLTLDIARQQNDSFNIGAAHFNIGIAYRYLFDLDSALQYTLEGARLLDGRGYDNIESSLNDGLQSLYMSLMQYDKAIQHGEKAVALGRRLENKQPLVNALNNLGLSYVEVNRTDDAKKVYKEGLDIATRINYRAVEAMLLNNLADIAIREGEYELAGTYGQRSLSIGNELEDDGTVMNAKTILACYYLYKNDFKRSEELSNEVLRLAEKQSFDDGKIAALGVLSNIAFATRQYSKGFSYQSQQAKIQSAVFNESVKQREAGMRVRFETEKKDSQIKLQKAVIQRKNAFNYILIGSAATLLIISLLSFRTYKQKQRIQQQRIYELETEKKLAATEAVLKGEEQERTRLAKDLHDGLGGMLSGIKYSFQTMKGNLIMTPENHQAFERSMDMLDSSIREMRRVAHNMMPEALVKFGLDTALKDFCADINQTGALNVSYQSIGMEASVIEQTTAITVYRIVQELINNTMKHAAAKNAIVQVSRTNGILSVTVEDDGKGFDTAVLSQVRGIGWDNIKNRVEFLKGTLDVDSQPGKGTSVHIELNT